MSSISANQRVSKRSLTLNKSFLLSIFFHTVLIFGVTFTTFYKIPLIDESPIINVKFANSSQDSIGKLNESVNNTFESNNSKEGTFTKKVERKIYQAQKIKKLQANSTVTNEEAMYLNLWQREIESIGDVLIAANDIEYTDSKVQVMATIDSFGNLIKSEILISSGNTYVDKMAIDILEKAAPFAPFDPMMINEYGILEIIRDWNFTSR
jgi:outer membrane biosynthesis protein TonB